MLSDKIDATDQTVKRVLSKTKFGDEKANITINERQRFMINKLFDGFIGNLTSSKWAKIAKCSADKALRDIQYLIDKNILQKEEAGGRSTS